MAAYCDNNPLLLWWCCSVAKSKWLEDAVAQLSLQPTAAATDFLQQQQQQAQQGLDFGVLKAFDLSLLRYQDRDALLETFQRYRQKVSSRHGPCLVRLLVMLPQLLQHCWPEDLHG